MDVNPRLWVEHKDDAGLIDVRPYAATLTRHTPVYCKQYPLSKEKNRWDSAATMQDSDDIAWTAEMDHAFRHLKASLTRPPALGLPKYTTDFHLYVHEGGGTAAAILAQEHGGIYRPVAYLSKTLDSVARGLPACLRAVAAAAIMVQDLTS
uniref:Reverse transcriptase/retrotransposon-derived protein RNase H-like domain-containing protein n=1 Tax=Sinocyclocheilus grahami TaxID=75366 RepID=A0A672TDN2_SINGR